MTYETKALLGVMLAADVLLLLWCYIKGPKGKGFL